MATRLVVFSGPSGSGKSTIKDLLMKEFPTSFAFSVSHTTRQPREGEVDGVHYHFVKPEIMQTDIDAGKFVEYTKFAADKMYGTSKESIQSINKSNRICLMDIDEEGVRSIKKTDMSAIYIFIAPPSIEALRERLQKRGTENESQIEKRMSTAQSAMDYSMIKGSYDANIVNDDLEEAYNKLKLFLLQHFPILASSKETNETSENMLQSDKKEVSDIPEETTADSLESKEKNNLETNESQRFVMESSELGTTEDEKEVASVIEKILEKVDGSEPLNEDANKDSTSNNDEDKKNVDDVPVENENPENQIEAGVDDSEVDQLEREKSSEAVTIEDMTSNSDAKTASIEDVPLSPYKTEPAASNDVSSMTQTKGNDVAVMDVDDDNSKGDHAGIITSDVRKKQQNLVNTSQSSVVELEEEIKKESSVVCGAGRCVIS